MERTTTNTFLGQLAKPVFHQIEPGRARGDKVQVKPWMSPQPLLDLGVFVGSIIVEDQMQIQPGRKFSVQVSEEPQKLLMAVSLHTVADDSAFQQVQRCKQGGCSVALIIMRQSSTAAFLHGQAWLGSLQRLNLAFFIHTEDDGLVGRIEVETNHIGELLDKLFVPREFEGSDPMRL